MAALPAARSARVNELLLLLSLRPPAPLLVVPPGLSPKQTSCTHSLSQSLFGGVLQR